MKLISIFAPILVSLKKLVEVPQPSNINDDLLAIEKMLAEEIFTNKSGNYSIKYKGEVFEKKVTFHDITIETNQEYIVITKNSFHYNYKNKHYENRNKHVVRIQRYPLKYLEDKSNIKPGIARKFLERFQKANRVTCN